MKITWQVSDGYGGELRPHEVDIDDNDLADCETDEEREDMIAEIVEEEFRQKVSWTITHRE